MRQTQAQTYLLNNYLIDRGISLAETRRRYPNLIINEIAGDVYTVTVPIDAEREFERFQKMLNLLVGQESTV